MEDIRIQFYKRIKQLANGCWLWIGNIDSSNGYGRITHDGKYHKAHRISYLIHKGIIPEGLQIDHLCRNKWCVCPDHLEAVSLKENVLRGVGISAINKKKTHCKLGHILMLDNLYITSSGNRRCKACHALLEKKYRLERKEALNNGSTITHKFTT